MNRTALRPLTVALAGVAVCAGVPAAMASTASAPERAATSADAGAQKYTAVLKGRADLRAPNPAVHMRMTVNAHSAFTPDQPFRPAKSWGTAVFEHRSADPSVNFGYTIKVDCLTAGGPTATVTGEIVKAFPEEFKPLLHRRAGFSFYLGGKDGSPARVGVAAPTPKGQPQHQKCMAPAAETPAAQGGFTLKDTRPPF